MHRLLGYQASFLLLTAFTADHSREHPVLSILKLPRSTLTNNIAVAGTASRLPSHLWPAISGSNQPKLVSSSLVATHLLEERMRCLAPLCASQAAKASPKPPRPPMSR